jgi:hypothetical protein
MGWSNILQGILGIADGWLQGQQARQQARLNADLAIEQARANHEMDWDMIQAQNSGRSWKDELWTLIFAAPLVAIFVPVLQPYVISGFEALNTQVPDWYLAFVAIAVSAAFGYREIVRPFMERMTGRNS